MKKKIEIIFENESFLAVNKASGLLSIPDRIQSAQSLKEMLIEKYGTIFTVHRLDKETSGLILFAKTETTHKYLSSLFEDRKIEKYYVGIVVGEPREKSGLIEASITEHPTIKGQMVVQRNGKPASTSFEVLEGNRHYSLVSFQLHTGRTHQIRVHAKQIGHPLACDALYGDGKPVLLSSVKKKFKLSKLEEEERPMIDRLALHSHRLVFRDEQDVLYEITAPIPKTFTALMSQLKKNA
ncbi:MAG: RluA family pseudouridine synthase [Ferruginibacter sp.]|nr:RluA family pseudouridine synthase [Ferruginibacter sp.]